MQNETPALDVQEERAWRGLLRANATIVNILDRELEAEHHLGLPDYEVLMQLSGSSDASLRMTELAKEVLLSPSGLTRRLDGLVKEGLVERQPCPSDGRGLLAVITETGREKLKQMKPTHVRAVKEHMISCVTRDQLAQMIAALEQIANQSESATDLTRVETDDRPVELETATAGNWQ